MSVSCCCLLAGVDQRSSEDPPPLSAPPLPSSALISMSLTHVHLRVSDMRLMLHVCTLAAL